MYDRHRNALVCRFDRLMFPVRNGVPIMDLEQAHKLSASDDPNMLGIGTDSHSSGEFLACVLYLRGHSCTICLESLAGQGSTALAGKPLIQHVYERVQAARFDVYYCGHG